MTAKTPAVTGPGRDAGSRCGSSGMNEPFDLCSTRSWLRAMSLVGSRDKREGLSSGCALAVRRALSSEHVITRCVHESGNPSTRGMRSARITDGQSEQLSNIGHRERAHHCAEVSQMKGLCEAHSTDLLGGGLLVWRFDSPSFTIRTSIFENRDKKSRHVWLPG